MLIYAICGYEILGVSCEDLPLALDICRAFCLPYDKFKNTPDGGATFRMKLSTAKAFLGYAQKADLPIIRKATGGLPQMLKKCLRRPGLCLGMLLACLLTLWSASVVWDVRVSGNNTLSDREVKEGLAACGFSVGSKIWGLKVDALQNRVLMADQRIAWISVNMRGTVAYVEVREAVYPPVEDTDTPTHIVADMDGQIVRVELTRGNVRVHPLQWVSEGELLVSGVYDSEVLGMRLTHAKAKVYAKTAEMMVIEIPLAHKERVLCQEEEIWVENSLIFFEKTVKFSNKTRHTGEFCDIIMRESTPLSYFGVNLPIAYAQVWYLPYTWVDATYTYAEAEELAYLELSRRISCIQGGAEVLSKTIQTKQTPTSFVLTCELVAVRDIAREVCMAAP